jgi:tRNA-dihydrouridine synthase A
VVFFLEVERVVSVPRLRHSDVYQLKKDFPALVVVANGGVSEAQQVQQHLSMVDGVMVGRAAYDAPWFITQWDAIIERTADAAAMSMPPPSSSTTSTSSFASPPQHPPPSRDSVEDAMVAYMLQQTACRPPPFHWKSIARHMLGLRHGQV